MIVKQKAKKVSSKMKDDFRDLLKFSEKSLKDVWDNKQDDQSSWR